MAISLTSSYKSAVSRVESFCNNVGHAPPSALAQLKDGAIAHILKSGKQSHDLMFAIRQCKSPGELGMLPYSRPELFEVKGK